MTPTAKGSMFAQIFYRLNSTSTTEDQYLISKATFLNGMSDHHLEPSSVTEYLGWQVKNRQKSAKERDQTPFNPSGSFLGFYVLFESTRFHVWSLVHPPSSNCTSSPPCPRLLHSALVAAVLWSWILVASPRSIWIA